MLEQVGKTKRPSVSAVALRVLACVRLVSVTAAPGTTPPCESTTVPNTDALVVWARTGPDASSRRTRVAIAA
jgi:hypothetical protein